jgi:hypothetical protein
MSEPKLTTIRQEIAQSGAENFTFSDKTLKLKDLAGRSIRVVREDDGKFTIKADSLTYRLFHANKKNEIYANKTDIQNILSKITEPKTSIDDETRKTAGLLLKQFTPTPRTDDEKKAFMKRFADLHSTMSQSTVENPFRALELGKVSEYPAVYDFLAKAGALGGDGQKLKDHIKKCLLSGEDLSLVKDNKLLDEIAEEAFQDLKKKAAGMPKSRLFEYVNTLGEKGELKPREKFKTLIDAGWVGSRKSPDETKFNKFSEKVRTQMSEYDKILDDGRTNPPPYDKQEKTSREHRVNHARELKAAARELLYHDQRLTKTQEDLCRYAGLNSMEVKPAMDMINEKKIQLTEKFIGTLLDNVKDPIKKWHLQVAIEGKLNPKLESLAKDNAKKINERPPVNEEEAKKSVEQIKRFLNNVAEEDCFAYVWMVFENIENGMAKKLISDVINQARQAPEPSLWKSIRPKVY